MWGAAHTRLRPAAAMAGLVLGVALVASPPQLRAQDEGETLPNGCPVEVLPAEEPPEGWPLVYWQQSRPLGLPFRRGRLIRGVQMPEQGKDFFTWDPLLRETPNRSWRRWGTDGLIRKTLRLLAEFRLAHSAAPRIGIGDLSRRYGGSFRPGHASHQNGLDIDIYYPRRDRRECPPFRPRHINRRLAQSLVNRFVRAGAQYVFVGPRTGLRGPRRIVQPLAYHDDHLHVRLYSAQA